MSKRGFIFNSVRLSKPKRNVFNLSYENKLSCNMGDLVPFYVQDVLPKDTFKVGQEYLMRCQPLIAPIMHRVDVYQHYFFVPLRLIWDNFETFITGGENGTQTAVHPYISPATLVNSSGGKMYGAPGSLLDFLGYPSPVTATGSPDTTEKISSLRIRAYNLIYNEFYRDQNLQSAINNRTGDGLDSPSTVNMLLQKRCWKKDYFTSALPWQQRGPQVSIPYSGGNVALLAANPNLTRQKVKVWNAQTQQYEEKTSGWNNLAQGSSSVSEENSLYNNSSASSYEPALLDPNGTLQVNDLNIPINDFRRANALQRWFERNARAGSRYVEQILSHFGIHPSDYRLQRPMYLGGGKQPFTVSDVVQTSSTSDEDDTPQGNLAGKGFANNQQYVFNQTFEEHGIIIGLLSVLPRSSYQQGLNRHLSKMDKFDYAFPEFANIGEQPILSKELYYDQNSAQASANQQVFGYQSRYAEYKYNFDECHGDFKTSLNYWHLGRIFANRPQLNSSFVLADPSKRVFAVDTQQEDCLLFDFYNNVTCLRCLPAYGTPAI